MLLFINITPAVEPRYLTDAEQIKQNQKQVLCYWLTLIIFAENVPPNLIW